MTTPNSSNRGNGTEKRSKPGVSHHSLEGNSQNTLRKFSILQSGNPQTTNRSNKQLEPQANFGLFHAGVEILGQVGNSGRIKGSTPMGPALLYPFGCRRVFELGRLAFFSGAGGCLPSLLVGYMCASRAHRKQRCVCKGGR